MRVLPRLLFFLLLVLPPYLSAQSSPRIFFSDLESGPNRGGQNNNGVWVTIWGNGFGAERGRSTVTVGGGAAAEYPIWTDTKIPFQLRPAARTGDIVVSVRATAESGAGIGQPSGQSSPKSANFPSSNKSGPGDAAPRSGAARSGSNGLPFAVRAGKIFFVATDGNDRHNGRFGSPWRTIVHAKDSMSAGDTTYIGNGVTQNKEDSYTAYLSMDRDGGGNSGKPAAPKALVAYRGAAVPVGVGGGLEFGIRTPNIRARADYWVISQLHIIGGRQAMDLSATGWQIGGNQMEWPGADGQEGCVETSQSSRVRFYGNEVYNAGAAPASS